MTKKERALVRQRDFYKRILDASNHYQCQECLVPIASDGEDLHLDQQDLEVYSVLYKDSIKIKGACCYD